ncbi:hypothetical protein [Bacteriovorax sp. Seq25_V]|uniref:hypothetical protein n=1 Tax=Bacteriovorax sp. Seq25_V TaxID=1201288 RepID=UPI00038A0E48|nr:hypothetical protein [Bacteriovorax sp. Seq25_V]EQC43463.1 putative membrane protein [Bacteriovorax sp. Seq25_V]
MIKLSEKTKKFLLIFLGFKFITIWAASFSDFANPHVHRQKDTLGVAYSYYYNFFVKTGFEWKELLPSVMNRGDSSGITPMEFPFLNVILSPFFLISENYKFQFALLGFLVITFGFIIVSIKVWENKKIYNVDAEIIMRVLPFISILPIYLGKVIPDIWAFYIGLIGIGIAWERKITFKSLMLLSLALMIKPNVAPIYFLFLLEQKICLKRLMTMSIPVIVSFCYMLFGNKYIASVHDLKLYATEFRGLSYNLNEFFAQIYKYPKYINSIFITKFAIIICSFDRRLRNEYKLITLFIVISLFYVALCGTHTVIHSYYVLPVAVLSTIILFKIENKTILKLVLLLIVVRNVELVYNESKNIYKNTNKYSFRNDCTKLSSKLKTLGIEKVRTKFERYPNIGACGQVFTNSSESNYGIYESATLPDSVSILETYGPYTLVQFIK